MQTALIPVFSGTIQNQPTQLCNARDLHVFLEIRRDFTTWIKGRIDEYGFIDDEDFAIAESLSSPKSGSSKARSQRLTDYHLTLDTAKELAMVENNDRGRQVRRYFIQIEKDARNQPSSNPLQLPDLISTEQAGELSALIAERFPDGRKRAYAWGRFNNHFRLASYKSLPASRFAEACAYIPNMPDKGADIQPPAGVPDLRGTRWLLTVDHDGRQSMREVPEGASVLTHERMAEVLADPMGVAISDEVLEKLTKACMRRMLRRLDFFRNLHGYDVND